jgi:hypothetical protein
MADFDLIRWLGETHIVAYSKGGWIFIISLFVLPWAILVSKD